MGGGTHNGKMPVLNPDQTIDLKKWIKECQAMARHDFG
jgi:hypothetical protein